MFGYSLNPMASNLACHLAVFCLVNLRPLLVGGLFKLIAFATLACLLAFVVIHSAKICGLLVASLQTHVVSLFQSVVKYDRAERLSDEILGLDQITRSPFFQRPPPAISI